VSRPRERISPVVAVLAAAACLFLALPVAGLLWRTPWSNLINDLTTEAAGTALRLSIVCSMGATALSVALGMPLAWALARKRVPARRVIRGLALLPLVLPPVVGGVALLLALGRNGIAGQWLDSWFGVRLPFTTAGAILAEAFVALPFVVITAEAAFRAADRRLEDAARTLGASRSAVFRTVTLPLAAPALAAGVALAWARALGEFGATITFAGNTPGRTQTLPLQVYLALESGETGSAIALSLVLLAVSLAVLVGMRGRWFNVAR
jgi:molybdate transport system permease protein